MASYNKYNIFVQDLASGLHQMTSISTQVFKVALTNTGPSAANAVLADITEISAGNGYNAGGISGGTVTGVQASGTFKFTLGTDPVWTASGGTIGPFRYAVLYNSTPAAPNKPLIAYWDYGSSITLQIGETFTVDLDQTNGVFTLA